MAQSIRDRTKAPDESTDAREIWLLIRSWLTLLRVFLVIAIIIVAEIFEEKSLMNLSLSVWAIIIGFPLFLLMILAVVLVVMFPEIALWMPEQMIKNIN